MLQPAVNYAFSLVLGRRLNAASFSSVLVELVAVPANVVVLQTSIGGSLVPAGQLVSFTFPVQVNMGSSASYQQLLVRVTTPAGPIVLLDSVRFTAGAFPFSSSSTSTSTSTAMVGEHSSSSTSTASSSSTTLTSTSSSSLPDDENSGPNPTTTSSASAATTGATTTTGVLVQPTLANPSFEADAVTQGSTSAISSWTAVNTVVAVNLINGGPFPQQGNVLTAPGDRAQSALLFTAGQRTEMSQVLGGGFVLQAVARRLSVTVAVGQAASPIFPPFATLQLVAVESSTVLATTSVLADASVLNRFVDATVAVDLNSVPAAVLGQRLLFRCVVERAGAVFLDNVRVSLLPVATAFSLTGTAVGGIRHVEVLSLRNFDFEEEDLSRAADEFSFALPGFSVQGEAGTLRPSRGAFAATADGQLHAPAQGMQAAYLKRESSLTQSLPYKLSALDKVTLMAAVGRRGDRASALPEKVRLVLRVGTVVLAEATLEDLEATVPAGAHVWLSLSYVVPIDSVHVGARPALEVRADGGNKRAQVTVDNLVAAVESNVPLPEEHSNAFLQPVAMHFSGAGWAARGCGTLLSGLRGRRWGGG